jgi:uncharacterized damage-inducible protein DinB
MDDMVSGMTFTEILLPEFDAEMANTRKVLERVPDGKFDYQPHPKSMTLRRLASHVAEMPHWASITIDVEELNMQPGEKPLTWDTQAELLAAFDEKAADARTKIAGASDEVWAGTWTFKYAGQVVMAMPRREVMRSMVMNHLIHHRAQLGVYLRLNDVAVPGLYGPSADEK